MNFRRLIIYILPGVFLVLLVLGVVALLRSKTTLNAEQISGIVKWASNQQFSAGAHNNVALPMGLKELTPNGTVDVVELGNSQFILLIKLDRGAKGNYSGYVLSNQAIPPANLGTDYDGRPIISVKGLDVNDPVIERKVDAMTYVVYFDLG